MAETLAGAGTDVRRRSDALGPRKNLHIPIRTASRLAGPQHSIRLK